MSFPNSVITDLVATTIENRSRDLADNVSQHNAFLHFVEKSGNIEEADGGYEIREHFEFQENGNAGSYSGFDFLSVAQQDVISGAQYQWAQYAAPVVFSGRELSINSGKEKFIDLVKGRVASAEHTLRNLLNRHAYLDGTGNNGKNLTGLAAAVPLANTAGTYGNIARSTNTFWQNQKFQSTVDGTGAATAATIQGYWDTFLISMIRGSDRPNVIICAPNIYSLFEQSLQTIQRISDSTTAAAGFKSILFNADIPVVFDSISAIPTNVAYFLNTKFLKWRPYSGRNFVPLDKRMSFNQDAEVEALVWMGNITCSGLKFQGIYSNT
jgi:hypothetical protein